MEKSLNMILMAIFEIDILPNNIPPYFWILYVTLFDPIGSPLTKTTVFGPKFVSAPARPAPCYSSIHIEQPCLWGYFGMDVTKIFLCAQVYVEEISLMQVDLCLLHPTRTITPQMKNASIPSHSPLALSSCWIFSEWISSRIIKQLFAMII